MFYCLIDRALRRPSGPSLVILCRCELNAESCKLNEADYGQQIAEGLGSFSARKVDQVFDMDFG